MRLELTRSCDHYPLKVACIPISPPARRVPRTGLEPAHLAACAPETHASTNSAIWAKKKSGKRDSNSRPRPWQGRALPTELFPQFCKDLFPNGTANIRRIFETANFLWGFTKIFASGLRYTGCMIPEDRVRRDKVVLFYVNGTDLWPDKQLRNQLQNSGKNTNFRRSFSRCANKDNMFVLQ